MPRTAATSTSPKRKSTRPAAARSSRSIKPKPSPISAAPQQQVTITLTHEQIAKRAYEIWLAKGRPLGLDDQNWAEAEAELRAAATK